MKSPNSVISHYIEFDIKLCEMYLQMIALCIHTACSLNWLKPVLRFVTLSNLEDKSRLVPFRRLQVRHAKSTTVGHHSGMVTRDRKLQ